MVGHAPLERRILVRVQVSQHKLGFVTQCEQSKASNPCLPSGKPALQQFGKMVSGD